MSEHRLNGYQLPALTGMLLKTQAEGIRLEVGSEPFLVTKNGRVEIEAQPFDEESAEALVRAVADTREMRMWRESSAVDLIHTFGNSRFLFRAVNAFGIFRIDLRLLKS